MKAKHINSISCGQGAPSMSQILLAGKGVFPAEVVIVADTGFENDLTWSTGRKSTAKEYFDEITKPLAESFGLQAHFSRSKDASGEDLQDLQDSQFLTAEKCGIDMPMFGSRGGKLKQSCTDKYKKSAIRQQLRRLGATTATVNLGITMDEKHRCKRDEMKWEHKQYPLVHVSPMYRLDCIRMMKEEGIPYLVTTECDGCPHKDEQRWKALSPETVAELTKWEAQFKGEYFLTRECVPLSEAIEMYIEDANGESQQEFLGCDEGYCFT